MYNAKSIEIFVNEVHKKATEAAQAVYDNHQPELERRILAQIKPGDKLFTGMGTAFIENSKGEYVGEKLGDALTLLEYWDKCKAGFPTRDLVK